MLTVLNEQVFHGPSFWAPVPVIVLRVNIGELEKRLTRETPIFFDRLVALVPSLHDQGDVVSQAEGGLQRLLLDRLAFALQQLAATQVALMQRDLAAGAELTYAATHPTNTRGLYRVVYAYEHEEVGLAAGTLAVRLLNHLIVKQRAGLRLHPRAGDDARPACQAATPTPGYRRVRRCGPTARHPGPARAAAFRDTGDIVQLGTGAYQRRIAGSLPAETACSPSSSRRKRSSPIACSGRPASPCRRARVVRDVDGAAKAAANIGYPVVVKPLNASHGRGATIEVRDEMEVRETFLTAKRESRAGR